MTYTKRNDDYDKVYYRATSRVGEVIDLTGATITFKMESRSGQLLVNSPASILNATNGEMEYQLTEGDTIVDGLHRAEFTVTFSDGKEKTFPEDGYIQVNIVSDIDTNRDTATVEAVALTTTVVYWQGVVQTYADLPLSKVNGDTYQVENDTTATNNGTWRWNGDEWVKINSPQAYDTRLVNAEENIVSLDAQLAENTKQIGGFLDVKKFAVGDGVTDDTANIQQAMQYAYDNGINNVFIFGEFLVNGSLNPLVGQTIQIEGKIRTTVDTNVIFSVQQNDVTICGSGLLQGAGKTLGSSSGVVTNAVNTTVKSISVTGFSNVGVGTGIGASRPKFKGIIAYENKTGISVYKSNLALVSNNECYQNGITVNGGGIKILGVTDGQPQNFVISNNNCHDNYATGITVSNANRGVVSGNACNDNGGGSVGQGSGIVVILDSAGTSVSEISITGNMTNRNTDHGIVVQNNKSSSDIVTGVTVSGNTSSSNYKTGIRFVCGIDVCVISGNSCNTNGTSGSSTDYRHGIMIADRSTRNQIVGNTCLSNAEDGIRITDTSVDFTDTGSGENTISMNNCRSNGGYGIHIHTKSVSSTANRILSNFTRGNSLGEIRDTGTNTDRSNNRLSFNRLSGSASLVDGVATISTSEVKTGDRILVSVITPSGTQGALYIGSITDGTSFAVKSTSTTDTSTFSWKIDH